MLVCLIAKAKGSLAVLVDSDAWLLVCVVADGWIVLVLESRKLAEGKVVFALNRLRVLLLLSFQLHDFNIGIWAVIILLAFNLCQILFQLFLDLMSEIVYFCPRRHDITWRYDINTFSNYIHNLLVHCKFLLTLRVWLLINNIWALVQFDIMIASH